MSDLDEEGQRRSNGDITISSITKLCRSYSIFKKGHIGQFFDSLLYQGGFNSDHDAEIPIFWIIAAASI